MASQFYLTLPSNSSMEYFPANTLTNFKTKLAQPLELIGEWEVALSEFQYPVAGTIYVILTAIFMSIVAVRVILQ